MSKIITQDPYLSHYVLEKQMKPETKLYWKSFEKRMVNKVDRIVEMARGKREEVAGQKDWEIIGELVKFFAEEWPDEFNEFKASMPDIRRMRKAGGYSETREIRYIGAFPPRLLKLIKAIFPYQQFDKKFMNRFIKRFPLFMVGGAANSGTGRVII